MYSLFSGQMRGEIETNEDTLCLTRHSGDLGSHSNEPAKKVMCSESNQ